RSGEAPQNWGANFAPNVHDRNFGHGEDEDGLRIQPISFSDLQAIWTRPWPDDARADRRAWDRALRKGADAAAIIAAARAWVEAADPPRLLNPLAEWLDRDGWTKAPPAKRYSRNSTASVRSRQPRSRGGDIALAYVGIKEGDRSIVFGRYGRAQ